MPIVYGLIGIGLLPIRLGMSVDMSRQPKVHIMLQILFIRFDWPLRWNPKWGTQGLHWLLQGGNRPMPPIGTILSILKRHLRFEDLSVQARIGLQDAAHTALLAGGLRTAFQLLGRALVEPAGKVRVRVLPDYQNQCFLLAGGMHISARLGLLAHAGVLLGLHALQEMLKKQAARLPMVQREG